MTNDVGKRTSQTFRVIRESMASPDMVYVSMGVHQGVNWSVTPPPQALKHSTTAAGAAGVKGDKSIIGFHCKYVTKCLNECYPFRQFT